MNINSLHIISLEIPYPPDRGNVIGIYQRLKSFHEAGIEIILHAFYKEFKTPLELTSICKTVYLYPRLPMWRIKNLDTPLYIQSRRSKPLLEVLSKDHFPILFEGLHTMFHFNDPSLRDRQKYVRMHNIESEYYHQIAMLESNPFKKLYFQFESRTSKSFAQRALPLVDGIFALSSIETKALAALNVRTSWVPPFISQDLHIPAGLGSYALFHGDLSIKENELGARFLINEVFNEIDFPLVIAGFHPSASLKSLIRKNSTIQLFDTPEIIQMNSLIEHAQIILCPFIHTTGYKMKLLQSLIKGRHIITSKISKSFQELHPVLRYADTILEWRSIVNELISKEVTEEQKQKRFDLMHSVFNNKINAERMIKIIFKD